MSLVGFNQLGKAIEEQGRYHYQYLYKASTPTSGAARYFVDLNQTSGQPKYNPFAGSELTATPLTGAGNAGIYVGNFVDGLDKHLSKITIVQSQTANASPDLLMLNDYLCFYPLIDCDNPDPQVMDNTLPITRYVSGEGVRIVLVATAPMTTASSVTITYTNSQGVAGRSTTATVIPSTAIGVCATAVGTGGGTNQATPFWSLQDGDTGVRAIESIQFAGASGGFLTACLVKPIAQLMIYENQVAAEKQFGFESLTIPKIEPGAFLNFIVHRGGGGSPLNLQGELIFINS